MHPALKQAVGRAPEAVHAPVLGWGVGGNGKKVGAAWARAAESVGKDHGFDKGKAGGKRCDTLLRGRAEQRGAEVAAHVSYVRQCFGLWWMVSMIPLSQNPAVPLVPARGGTMSTPRTVPCAQPATPQNVPRPRTPWGPTRASAAAGSAGGVRTARPCTVAGCSLNTGRRCVTDLGYLKAACRLVPLHGSVLCDGVRRQGGAGMTFAMH